MGACSLAPLPGAIAKRVAARLDALSPSAEPEDGFREAAVAVVLGLGDPVDGDDALRVLLMHRTEHPEDRWSGHVSFPGGHRDPGDTSLVRTAMREAHEEVGVALESAGEVLGVLPSIQASGRGRLLPMRVAPIVFGLRRAVQAHPGPEAQAVFALPLALAAEGALDASFRPPEREHSGFDYPAYGYGGHVVWGMTHRMLGALLTRLDGTLLRPPS